MKNKLLLFVPLFLLVGANATETFASDDLKEAQFICSLIVSDPTFDYAKNFDAVFISKVPQSALVQIFSSIFKKHGTCSQVGPAPLSQAGDKAPTFFLTLADGFRSVFSLGPTPDGSKVQTLFYQGELSPDLNFDLREESVSTLDGNHLRTLVFKSTGSKTPKPVVLVRTPYFRYNAGIFTYAYYFPEAQYFLDRGYNFVLQAIHGTGGSSGKYHYLDPREIDDGALTVEWIASQPFCDGNIGVTGTSYDGFTSLAAGVKNPKGLKVIFAGGAPTSAYLGGFI